jgi:hypothetical protein
LKSVAIDEDVAAASSVAHVAIVPAATSLVDARDTCTFAPRDQRSTYVVVVVVDISAAVEDSTPTGLTSNRNFTPAPRRTGRANLDVAPDVALFNRPNIYSTRRRARDDDVRDRICRDSWRLRLNSLHSASRV